MLKGAKKEDEKMEIKMLYVLVVKGEKHYFKSEIDRNHGYNVLTKNGTIESTTYEIDLTKMEEKN